ncbi:transcriptional activator DEMETER-like [Chenopodium quinoa]|uniref:transcriptional activator DEMETER-like n=1 Tax=Chenopodium quinoa TaxID=63459 RepID=UPI000B78780C|nr:transcriptional activator DEMETER-like [Chenopodium quinoa]XP_021747359.1 transcriptional activator DEMETER-like [Chenopodium quinoa]
MENYKGKSIPIVNDFGINGPWIPFTPLNPHLGPINENGDVGNYLSAFSQQNNHAQTLLSYSGTPPSINNGISSIPSSSSNTNHHQHLRYDDGGRLMQRRGLEYYLPAWNSQGMRTNVAYPWTNPTAAAAQGSYISDYPYLSSWESSMPWTQNGIGDGTFPAASASAAAMEQFETMSYTGLLCSNDISGLGLGMGSEAVYQGWDYNQYLGGYNTDVYGNPIYNPIFQREMQSCASPHQYQSVYDANSSQDTKHANGNYSNFAPATPDSRWRIDSNEAPGNSPFGTYQRSTEQNRLPEQVKQVAAAVMINVHNVQEGVTIPNTQESSTGKVSMTVENHNPDKGSDQVIDLNKTPQKKTRRRKYTPKVLSEKKPKHTPKPKTPKPTDPKEDTQVKRKYVRKNKVNTPLETATEGEQTPAGATEAGVSTPTGETEARNSKQSGLVAKSCRKSLNFDLNGQAESNFPHMPNGYLHVVPQPNMCDTTLRMGQELMVETSKVCTAYELNYTQHQELKKYLSLPTKDYQNNTQPDLINLSKEIDEGHHSLLGNNTEVSSRNEAHLAQSPNSSPCASSNEQKISRGSKRRNYCMADIAAGSVDAANHCTFWQPNHSNFGNATTGELHTFLFPEIFKKKRTEKVQRPHIPSMPSTTATSEDINLVADTQNHSRVYPTTSKYYCNPASYSNNAVSHNHAELLMGSVEDTVQPLDSWTDMAKLKKKKRSKGTTRVSDLAPLRGKPGPKGPRKKTSNTSEHASTEALEVDSTPKPRSKRESRKQNSSNKRDLILYDANQPARKATGSVPALPWVRTSSSSIEDLTEGMKLLDINREGYSFSLQEQNALVPYKAKKVKNARNGLVVYGREGTIVPFDGPFDPVRKRHQRPKVDLDDETTKVWKLLLENSDNKGVDGTDEDKARWWANERSVFHGRVDSFIARMRLVQGDRRFTPWKGSVLDSVIGVFLTQNVADHLSSSAFMKMAAHFPLKSEGSESTLSVESTTTTALAVEPNICIIEPEKSITWNEKTDSEEKDVVSSKEVTGRAPGSVSPKDYSSENSQKTPNNSTVDNANSQTTETETASVLGDDRANDDATSSQDLQHSAVSSQNTINSPNLQTAGTMSIFSENYSNTQPLVTGSQSNYFDCSTLSVSRLKMAESPFLNEPYSQTQQDPLECINHVTISSLESQGFCANNDQLNLNFQLPDVDRRSPHISRKDENSKPTEQSNLTTESAVHHFAQEKSSDSIPRSFPDNNHSFHVLEGDNMVMHSQKQSMKEPSHDVSSANVQTSSNWKSAKLKNEVTTDVTESTAELKRASNDLKIIEKISEQKYASGGISAMTNASAGESEKGKAEVKANAFDWDSLRKQVEPNGIKKERTANTRDSADWEAVRHADVNEIAETIKARGMSIKLAGRIKRLLDRLVKDHGSIDMEWLRDIPPDKTKEYLLSVKGLGLKSVECVRLLTLHHLAFPVDTNVGRIAVRLGWVPLQPLPESLQLHLLELYPILASIQKYLWPRLCKLDQKTLYELHYHLITFGKVFCTKQQPNCNACPMRGDCRHFASAFANARFALPRPEERSIMPSSGGSSAHPNSQASTNPLLLPPSYSQSNCVNGAPISAVSSSPLALHYQQTQLERQSEIRNCEPIVEVPASPEPLPEQEQTLCDIEDTFYDDPNEIPIVKIHMEPLSQTLENCRDRNSSALVALTPEAASIPTPKLKNISRLRTEHHVYELPDTHPLLKGLGKREPDDPCSYLLAIWTPGETASSIEPPERKCHSEDPSILCNEETCSYCNSQRESNSHSVRGTLLIPCRTAMRGSFPLNGTYFQVNEVFADHESSINPIAVPRTLLWNLPRRMVYFGTSIPTIFRGLTTADIQRCFWRGFVCVRGFDRKRRAPRPLIARLHFPASKTKGAKGKTHDE